MITVLLAFLGITACCLDIMHAGDVLLLEAQTSYPTASGFVPVEVKLGYLGQTCILTMIGPSTALFAAHCF